jgi:hypothetical protein
MDKEQYFHAVQHNQAAVMYEMYKEKFDAAKHKPFLQPEQFMMYLQLSGMMNQAFEAACHYYEQKFDITKLFDKTGKLIRFV